MPIIQQRHISGQLEYSGAGERLDQQALEKKPRGIPSSSTWRILLNLGDNIIIIASFLLAIRFMAQLQKIASLPSWEPLIFFAGCLTLVLWNITASMAEAYDLINACSRVRSLLCVLVSLLLMLIAWVLLIPLFSPLNYVLSIEVLFCFLGIAFPFLGLWRMAFAAFINLPRFLPRAVIVGVNKTGELAAKELRSLKGLRLNVAGYINEKNASSPLDAIEGLPILGGDETLRRLIHTSAIDTIIMAIDYHNDPVLFKDALNAVKHGITVIPATAIFERFSGKVPVEHIGEQWYSLLPTEKNILPFYLCWRKVLEILFGLAGLVLLVLVTLILAPLIYLDSPGAIFYTQERIGYQGRTFRIYKFRSMHTNSESKGWTTTGDARVTRVGAFLRPTHLDELPQVLNILLGDMTLIGPRPERPAYVSKLETSIPFYHSRLSVKPGLTGWAQVKYRYGNTDQDALIKLQYDLYYIKHRSFILDVMILLMTVVEVLFSRGL